MMRKSPIIILFLIFLAGASQAQEVKFPVPIYPGETFTVPMKYDTLFWLLKNSQYNNALEKARALAIADTMISTLKMKNSRLSQIIAEKDSLIKINQQGYEHYKELWRKTDHELEKAELKYIGQFKAGLTGFYIGSLLTILAGAAIHYF